MSLQNYYLNSTVHNLTSKLNILYHLCLLCGYCRQSLDGFARIGWGFGRMSTIVGQRVVATGVRRKIIAAFLIPVDCIVIAFILLSDRMGLMNFSYSLLFLIFFFYLSIFRLITKFRYLTNRLIQVTLRFKALINGHISFDAFY